MKWFYRNFIVFLIVLIAAILIMMAICMIGEAMLSTHMQF